MSIADQTPMFEGGLNRTRPATMSAVSSAEIPDAIQSGSGEQSASQKARILPRLRLTPRFLAAYELVGA